MKKENYELTIKHRNGNIQKDVPFKCEERIAPFREGEVSCFIKGNDVNPLVENALEKFGYIKKGICKIESSDIDLSEEDVGQGDFSIVKENRGKILPQGYIELFIDDKNEELYDALHSDELFEDVDPNAPIPLMDIPSEGKVDIESMTVSIPKEKASKIKEFCL